MGIGFNKMVELTASAIFSPFANSSPPSPLLLEREKGCNKCIAKCSGAELRGGLVMGTGLCKAFNLTASAISSPFAGE